MKIVSVIFFALALTGTWFLAHANKPVAESVHIGIQNDLKRIITEYVQKNLPESKNLRFTKFWTETLKNDKVKAYFLYSFEDTTEEGEPAEVEIDGSAILNKVDETAENSTWSFDELQILDTKVRFNEPIQINARAGELESQQPAQEEKKEDHKEQH
ncbi:MAG: hypothetical protein KF799_00900 [Bdellovibrionales bacterium]|nr:hypothetical protein [Bdellovibrionales bacterium]